MSPIYFNKKLYVFLINIYTLVITIIFYSPNIIPYSLTTNFLTLNHDYSSSLPLILCPNHSHSYFIYTTTLRRYYNSYLSHLTSFPYTFSITLLFFTSTYCLIRSVLGLYALNLFIRLPITPLLCLALSYRLIIIYFIAYYLGF